MRKIASIILSVIMLLPLCTFASDLPTYDVNAAIEYAAKHVNDNDGSQCAEFVSKCVQAGGLNIPTKTGTKGCWDAILDASGLSGENLTLNQKGYVTKNTNKNLLSRGDVVIQWCHTCDLRPHILICSGYDSEDYATFYAHNSALNNERYNFSKNSQHKESCNIGAKVVQLSKLNNNNVPSNTTSTATPDNDTVSNNTSSKQKCGDNAYWQLDNGILTISGTGDMWDFKNGVIYDNSPDASSIELTSTVHTITVDEGITSLGKCAFVRMTNVKNVSLPSTLKTIKAGAFFCVEPENITYNGSKDDWKKIPDEGIGTTMPLADDFILKISFSDTTISNDSEPASPYKTGILYQIEVTDDNGNKVAVANINEKGLITKIKAKDYHNAYICFQPLFNVPGSFIDGYFIGAETYFEYQNNKVSSISSKDTLLGDKDGEHKANIFGQIIDSYNGIYEFNDEGLCTKEKHRVSYEEKYWKYNEHKLMSEYGYIGMAPTYFYYYDAIGRLESFEVAGPGYSENYVYEYQSTENEHATSNIKILINNKFIQCDQPPVLVNNRTLVPMRAIFEALGAKVEWDNSTRTAIGTKEGKTVSLTIEEKAINIDGVKKELDVAPQIINNRTMIPVRAVAEAFDCDVEWNATQNHVIITQDSEKP